MITSKNNLLLAIHNTINSPLTIDQDATYNREAQIHLIELEPTLSVASQSPPQVPQSLALAGVSEIYTQKRVTILEKLIRNRHMLQATGAYAGARGKVFDRKKLVEYYRELTGVSTKEMKKKITRDLEKMIDDYEQWKREH